MKRLALVTAWALLTACRPDVESTVPCAKDGDLSCPTGFHCGANGRCEPGERTPSIQVLSPSAGRASGRVSFAIEATSPRGIANATVRLISDGDVEGRAIEATRSPSPDGTRLTINGWIDTWEFPDGTYELVAEALASTEPKGPATARVRLEIENRAPTPAFISPSVDAVVRDAIEVSGSVTHDAPLAAATIELRRADQVLADVEGVVSTDTFNGTLDLSGVTDGPATLHVGVRDVAGRTGSTDRAVVIHNTRLAVITTTVKPVGLAGGTVTIVLNEAPAQAPSLVANGLKIEAPQSADQGRSWTWQLTASGATSNVTGKITLVSTAGDSLESPLDIGVDLVPPALVDGLRLENFASSVRLRFACSEQASWSIGTPASTGTCDSVLTSRPAPTAKRGDRLQLVDAAGNTAEFAFTEREEEEPLAFTAGSLRMPANRPDPHGVAALVAVTTSSTDLSANDGAALIATTTDAPAPAFARAGLLRRTSTRPVALSTATAGTLLLGIPEGSGTRGRLSIYEWTQASGAVLQGLSAIDLRVRPALHPTSGRLAFARNGRLLYGALAGPSQDLGSIEALASSSTDAASCGTNYVALVMNAANSPTTLVADLQGNVSPFTFAAPTEAASPSARLLCASGRVLLIAPGTNAMLAWELDTSARAWTTRSTGSMAIRNAFSSGENLIASGTRADGTLLRDAWRWDGVAFQPLATGPGRTGGSIVSGPASSTLVVGGIGAGAWGLVASSEDGWTEHGSATPVLPEAGAMAWAYDRSTMVVLADENATTSRIWEWNANGGWSAGAAIPYRRSATLVARAGSVLVTGGVTASGASLGTSFAWDGRTASPTPGVDGNGLVATTLSDGRIVFAGGSDPATRGTIDVRSATLGTGTRLSLTTNDVQLLSVPGRDVITWLSAGSLFESRIGGAAATPLGSLAIDAAFTPVVLPGAGLFLASVGDVVAWRALPSASGAVSPTANTTWTSARGPCFSSEPATREATCVTTIEDDPPVASYVDRAHAAAAFMPSGSGAGHVELCARANVGGVRSGDVSVHVLSGNTVLTTTGAMSGNCRRFEFDYAASPDAAVVVVASPPHTDTTAAKLELDTFRATRIAPGP